MLYNALKTFLLLLYFTHSLMTMTHEQAVHYVFLCLGSLREKIKLSKAETLRLLMLCIVYIGKDLVRRAGPI